MLTDDNRIEFEPTPGFVGTAEFEYVVDRRKATVRVDVKRAWHNHDEPMDVDRNGRVAPHDLLQVVNLIAEHGAVSIDRLDVAAGDAVFADVNNDGQLSPWDALLMVNGMREPEATSIIDRAFHDEGEVLEPETTLF